MDINKAAVLGAGRMGRQIGLCAAIHGVETYVYDNNPEVIEDVRKWAEEYLAGRIAKGRMTEEQVAAAKALFHIEPDLAKAVRDAMLKAYCEHTGWTPPVTPEQSDATAETKAKEVDREQQHA